MKCRKAIRIKKMSKITHEMKNNDRMTFPTQWMVNRKRIGKTRQNGNCSMTKTIDRSELDDDRNKE